MSPRVRTAASESQMFCGCGIPRRRFLTGVGTLATSFLLPGADLEAQTPPSGQRKVDIHSHYAPPQWAAAIPAKINQGAKMNSPLNSFKGWAPAVSIEVMDQAGVATFMLSITTPGIWYGEKYSPIEETRRLARDCNEFAAKMRADYKGRFGQFAVLPLPDVEGSLREIEYALDTLKADGCGVLTNYGEIYGDRLLGDPALAPVFQELNRRKALVYVHRRIYSGPYEIFGWDHFRTILSLIRTPARGETGVPSPRYPDIRFIISHSGGLMPFTFERSNTPQGAETKEEVATRNAMLAVLRQFHYDTAHSNNAYTLSALKKLIPVSQIMFGTDYPLIKVAEELKKAVEESTGDSIAGDRCGFSSGLSAQKRPRVESGRCDGWSGRLLDRGFHDVSYPDQVVSGGGESEHPTDAFTASVLGLAQTGRGLDPAEDLLDELAFLLALAITIVACGAFINAARTS